MNNQIQIRPLVREDIKPILKAFNQIGWNKPPSLFEIYLKEQETGERLIWVAFINRQHKPLIHVTCERRKVIQENNNDWIASSCAPSNDAIAGYVTLKWHSKYPSFKEKTIPEIMDLNVLPCMQKMGVGSLLLDIAEKEAATRSEAVGIGVGLYAGGKTVVMDQLRGFM